MVITQARIAPETQSDSLGLAADRNVRQRPATPSEAERRRGLRIRQARPIKIFEPTSTRYFGGQTLDISATGLRIELPLSTPVLPGSLLNIHVGLSQQGQSLANRRQMMQAKVVWVDRPRDLRTSTLTAGIEFHTSIAAHLDAA
jgi:hypothetical protein